MHGWIFHLFSAMFSVITIFMWKHFSIHHTHARTPTTKTAPCSIQRGPKKRRCVPGPIMTAETLTCEIFHFATRMIRLRALRETVEKWLIFSIHCTRCYAACIQIERIANFLMELSAASTSRIKRNSYKCYFIYLFSLLHTSISCTLKHRGERERF